MFPRCAVVCLFVTALTGAHAQAQPKPTLPDAAPRWTDDAGVQGVVLRCVDAVTGAAIESGRVVLAGKGPAAHPDGSLRLAAGVHWFEATAAGYLTRRTRAQLGKEQGRGVLLIPMFPEFTFVVGRVKDGAGCSVAVVTEDAADEPFCTGRGVCDAEGRFELRLRRLPAPLPAPLEVQVLVGPRVAATVQHAPVKVLRGTDATGEHRGIAAVDCGALAFALTPAHTVFLDKYARRPTAAAAFRQQHAALAAATDAALRWLVAHQDEAGCWNCDEFMAHDPATDRCSGPGDPLHDVGVTGLAVMALLARGGFPSGPCAPAVARAVAWLRGQQAPDGLIGVEASHRFFYGHLIATQALCEALAFAEEPALRTACERAVEYVLAFRHPDHMWWYQRKATRSTTSVAGWVVHALAAARDVGIAVPDEVLVRVARHYDALTDDTGRTGYTGLGDLGSRYGGGHDLRFPAERFEALTAAAVLARALLRGAGIDAATPRAAIDLLVRKPPKWQPDAIDEYAWMLAAHAIAQADAGKRAAWQKALADAVLPAQQRAGAAAGSWDPVGVWADDFGRVGSTALLALALQAPHRFVRLP